MLVVEIPCTGKWAWVDEDGDGFSIYKLHRNNTAAYFVMSFQVGINCTYITLGYRRDGFEELYIDIIDDVCDMVREKINNIKHGIVEHFSYGSRDTRFAYGKPLAIGDDRVLFAQRFLSSYTAIQVAIIVGLVLSS